MNQVLKMNWQLAMLLIALGLFCACNDAGTIEKKVKLGLVEPPIPELAKEYALFEIDPTKDETIDLPSGTKITIPANSLIDKEGNLLTDKTTLKYREYHDAVDVLLSGIPMDYKVLGTRRVMQTAGMFDIAAEQEGKKAYLAEGKTIRVDFASYEAGEEYNFFALNEDEGWQFVDYVAPEENTARQAAAKEVKRLQKKVRGLSKGYFVFNYEAILDVMYNNYSDRQKNRNSSSLKTKVKRYGLNYYASSLYKRISYKGNYYPADMMVWKNTGKSFPSWLRQDQCQLTLLPFEGHVSVLEAKSKDGKTFSGKIEAILPLKYVFKYSPQEWKKELSKILKDVAVEEEKLRLELEQARLRMEQQAAVIRSSEIAGFGIYNYDKLMKEEAKVEVLADFKLEGAEDLDWVICLPEDGKTVIKYPQRDWDKVVLLPNNAARFIAILPNKKVGIYAVEKYQAIDFDQLKSASTKPNCTFALEQVLESLSSEEDLRTVLKQTMS